MRFYLHSICNSLIYLNFCTSISEASDEGRNNILIQDYKIRLLQHQKSFNIKLNVIVSIDQLSIFDSFTLSDFATSSISDESLKISSDMVELRYVVFRKSFKESFMDSTCLL